MIIGVDVGYGYTKAIAENGESLIFPSAVGTGYERKMEKLINTRQSDTDNYDLVIEHNGEKKHYFVGNLAILQSSDAARPFSDDRSKAEEIQPALLTAIAGLAKGDKVTLVTGLPLEPFFKQAQSLKTSLEKMSGIQVVLNGERFVIQLEQVIMFPQAVAAMYAQIKKNNNGKSGMVGLIDMGFRTTDIIMFDLSERKFMDSYKETLPYGMNNIVIGIQDEIKNDTGYTASLEQIEQSLMKQRLLFFDRKEYDVVEMASRQESSLRNYIVSNIKRRWRDKQKELKMVYLVGGGAFLIRSGISEFADCEVVQGAQFANARGYMLRGLAARENGFAVSN
jgi:plasmid segregation protein ParM